MISNDIVIYRNVRTKVDSLESLKLWIKSLHFTVNVPNETFVVCDILINIIVSVLHTAADTQNQTVVTIVDILLQSSKSVSTLTGPMTT